MIQRNLDYFIAAARQETLTENDPAVTDLEVTNRLTDALSSLYDLIISTYQHYAVKNFDFTLAGGVGGNSVTLPSDFYKDVGLNLNPNDPSPVTVNSFQSWVERNILPRREYTLLGNSLVVSPTSLAKGNYRLFYTPLVEAWFDPRITVTNTDTVSVGLGNATYTLANLNTALVDYNGATITVTGASHGGNNGTFTVSRVSDFDAVQCVATTQVAETFSAATVTITIQPAGSIFTLPQIYLPWYEYIQVHAATAIKQKLEQDTTDLEQRKSILVQRIQAMAANRQEEGGQAAIVNPSLRVSWGPGVDEGWGNW